MKGRLNLALNVGLFECRYLLFMQNLPNAIIHCLKLGFSCGSVFCISLLVVYMPFKISII